MTILLDLNYSVNKHDVTEFKVFLFFFFSLFYLKREEQCVISFIKIAFEMLITLLLLSITDISTSLKTEITELAVEGEEQYDIS